MSEKRTLNLYTVDAFTDVPFKGNPAAVCPLSFDSNLSDEVLQNIAMEMNLSETAFIKLLDTSDAFNKGSVFGLRWFTPKTEIKMCGHATLASAAVMFYCLENCQERIVFKTLSGDLIVKKAGSYLHMDFPVGKSVKQNADDHQALIASLGADIGISEVFYCESLRYMLIRLNDGWSRNQFEKWTPNVDAMHRANDNLVVLIITTRGPPEDGYKNEAGEPYDFVSRCFAPWTGVPEDPVTGSAQTVLAYYWAKQLDKTEFNVRQCSSRSGEISLKLSGDRVEILGKAVLVMEGTLKI